jgi:adenosylcobinamide kinase/adenosylcobinamide-phosphate guanylyltransferase
VFGGARGRENGINQVITLLLGGARSGKSELAERMASALPGPVSYVATAQAGGDEDFAKRIEEHRSRRPHDWKTIESGRELVDVLRGLSGTVVVDSLGTWVASMPGFDVDPAPLCEVLAGYDGSVLIVSEEVGLGVHPSTEVGGRFRDALGTVNRSVAQVADEVILVVAGCSLRLDKPGTGASLP